jgi:hypothetical protein
MENEHKFSDEDPTLVDAKAIEIELDDTDTGKEEKGYILDTAKYTLKNLDAAVEIELDKMAKKNPNFDREKIKGEIYFEIMEALSERGEKK